MIMAMTMATPPWSFSLVEGFLNRGFVSSDFKLQHFLSEEVSQHSVKLLGSSCPGQVWFSPCEPHSAPEVPCIKVCVNIRTVIRRDIIVGHRGRVLFLPM